MTDEPKEGQSHEDNALDALQDATQPDSAQTGDEPALPERFQGKSPAEIAQSYVELERKMSEQGQELGTLRNQVAFMQTQNQYSQQPEPQYQQPAYPNVGQQPVDPNYDDRFLESPFQTTMQMIQSYDNYRRMDEAQRNFPIAMKMATDARPDLFDSPDVTQQVQQVIQNGVRTGHFRPEVQNDPNSINAIALWLKDQRVRHTPLTQPVQPVATEAPPQVKKSEPGKRPVEFTDRGEQDFLRHVRTLEGFENFSDEDAAEMVREAEKERARGRR